MWNLFRISEQGSNVKTEILAGSTTFLTMAYIVVVNPAMLSSIGMPFSGVLFATVLVSVLSSIAMGLYAGLPFALAPGMGISAFFTYSLVKGMGIAWETALGAVFVSGIVFLILSVTRVRTIIVMAIPDLLRHATAAGIGIFLTLIGLTSVDFITYTPHTILGFGGLSVTTALFLTGFLFTSFLMMKRVKGFLMLGIITTSILTFVVSHVGVAAGLLSQPLVATPAKIFSLPSFDVFLKLDIRSALSLGMIAPIFALLFTDMFDSISTFLGVAQVSNLLDEDGQPINVDRALLVDAFSTTISGLAGTSSGTTYIESSAGVAAGGKTGLTAVVTGILFLPFMFLSPLLSLIPPVATAPVLVIVGVFMTQSLAHINWKDFEEAIPAFLTIILIPLTYSITQGIIWGFVMYTAIKLMAGKAKDIHWMLYVIDLFAIVSLILPLFPMR